MNKKQEIKYMLGEATEQDKKILDRFLTQYDIHLEDDDCNIESRTTECPEQQVDPSVFTRIRKKTIIKELQQKRIIRYGSVAVVLVFCFLLKLNLTKPDTHENNTIIYSQAIPQKEYDNTTDKIKNIILEDGSVVDLYPGANITYVQGFEKVKRDVLLEGKAIFKVAKDATRPFTVYSGAITTTALGTKFMVDNTTKNISVELYEGKIVVKKIDNTSSRDRYYLEPGYAINYNCAAKDFSAITKIEKTNTIATSFRRIPGRQLYKKEQSSIVMEGVGLPDALTRLAKEYNVEIEYSISEIDNIKVVANVSRKQPIEKILSNIAQMNNLILHKENDKKFSLKPTPALAKEPLK